MKTDIERKEVADQITNILRQAKSLRVDEAQTVTYVYIQEYEQPYIDRIKELEEVLEEAINEFEKASAPLKQRKIWFKAYKLLKKIK